MLSLDLVWIGSGLSLDLVETAEGQGPVKCEGPAVGPGLFSFAYWFNYTPWRETTMPTIFLG
jgi:hypothetical protein